MADKYQMRLVVSNVVSRGVLETDIDAPVCIDVVFRGATGDIAKVMPIVRAWLDAGSPFSGDWAGIGRGDYVEGTITLG